MKYGTQGELLSFCGEDWDDEADAANAIDLVFESTARDHACHSLQVSCLRLGEHGSKTLPDPSQQARRRTPHGFLCSPQPAKFTNEPSTPPCPAEAVLRPPAYHKGLRLFLFCSFKIGPRGDPLINFPFSSSLVVANPLVLLYNTKCLTPSPILSDSAKSTCFKFEGQNEQ